jgi:hypothetical protein
MPREETQPSSPGSRTFNWTGKGLTISVIGWFPSTELSHRIRFLVSTHQSAQQYQFSRHFEETAAKTTLFGVTYMSLLWLLVVFLNKHLMKLKYFKCLVHITLYY